jgi:thiopeptide-type bacteriocin biosynthesis protein
MRAPLMPVEAYPHVAPDEVHRDSMLPADSRVRAALAVGTEHLYSALQRTPPASPEAPRLRRKLLRYLIRMTTRPTPFGLFAGVGLVEWGTATDVRLVAAPPRTRARPDMGWLFGLVAELERDPAVRRCLRLFVNQLALMRAGHVRVDDRMGLIGRGAAGSAPGLTRMTAPAQEVLSRTGTGTSVPSAHLFDLLLARPGATAEKVDRLIEELLNRSLLLTDLRPPLTGVEPGRYVYDRLQGVSAARETRDGLGELLLALERWDASPVEERVDGWAALIGRTAALHHSSAASATSGAIQVDAALPLSGRRVHRAVAEEAAQAAEVLLRLTPLPAGPPGLRAYRERFEARYGSAREVPLLELLDPDFGLGPPDDRDRALDTRREPSPAALLLRGLAVEALRERRLVVELDDRLLAPLRAASPSAPAAPRSVEISVQVAAASEAAVDTGDFKVIVGGGAELAGRSLGRFADLLGTRARAALADLDNREGAGERRLRAELVYLPGRVDAANLAVRPAFGSHEIVYGTTSSAPADRLIPLNELVIGVREGRFYVRWPRGRATIAVFERTVVHPLLAPPAIRFLRQVERDGHPVFGQVDWSLVEDLPVLPRLECGRLVLAPAQWRVDWAAEPASEPTVFSNALAAWRERWSVPRWVRLAEGDNWLLLDLDDPVHVEVFREEVRRSADVGAMAALEALPGPGDAWLPGPDGRHAAELVVPLVTAAPRDTPAPTAADQAPASPVAELSDRVRPPGSEWLFLKVYCPVALQDSLIAEKLRTLVAFAEAGELASSWFFIRYGDPEPHLRIRFHGNPQALFGHLLRHACSWAMGLMDQGSCLRFAIDTYEREVERYGGMAGVRIAEDLFAADSRAVVDLLDIERDVPTLNRTALAVLSVDALLEDLGLSADDRLAWYRARSELSAADGQEYRKCRHVLQRVLIDGAASEQGGDAIDRILVNRRQSVQPLATQVAELAREQGGAHVKVGLLVSYVHMHCNRLLGPTVSEDLVLRLARRTREALTRLSIARNRMRVDVDPDGQR